MNALNAKFPCSKNLPVTICVLCYGPHQDLAERCLGALLRHTQPAHFRLRLGLNTVCAGTRELAGKIVACSPDTIVHDSDINLFKVPMMRRLLHQPPIDTGWVIWFDDDSHVFRPDWLPSLTAKMEAFPEVAMWGKPYSVQVPEKTAGFIREAGWFRGVPLRDSKEKRGYYRISFVEGGFWAIRAEALNKLDWPDLRLVHYHNDFTLGEAMRQNGFRLGSFHHGVRITDAHRRSPAGVPPGP